METNVAYTTTTTTKDNITEECYDYVDTSIKENSLKEEITTEEKYLHSNDEPFQDYSTIDDDNDDIFTSSNVSYITNTGAGNPNGKYIEEPNISDNIAYGTVGDLPTDDDYI